MAGKTDSLNTPILVSLKARVREIVKALGGPEAKEHDASVPVAPDDPDAIAPDQRVDGASPTDGDIDDASAEASAGQQGQAPPEGEAAPEGDEPDGDEGQGDGKGDEGDDSEFDSFGNADHGDEGRGIQKAYGNGTGQAEPDELLKGGPDLLQLLEALLGAVEDSNARTNFVIDELRAEVNKLKTGQTATDRKLSKGFEAIRDQMSLPPEPRAITKSLIPPVPPNPAPPSMSSNEIFTKLRDGSLSVEAATAIGRAQRGAATPNA